MLASLTPEKIEQVLYSEVLGRIGCHAEGRTYIVPITYAYYGERIICHSKAGMKIEMMRQNPAVCFEVEKVDNLANWRSVFARGRYEELHGEAGQKAMGGMVQTPQS